MEKEADARVAVELHGSHIGMEVYGDTENLLNVIISAAVHVTIDVSDTPEEAKVLLRSMADAFDDAVDALWEDHKKKVVRGEKDCNFQQVLGKTVKDPDAERYNDTPCPKAELNAKAAADSWAQDAANGLSS